MIRTFEFDFYCCGLSGNISIDGLVSESKPIEKSCIVQESESESGNGNKTNDITLITIFLPFTLLMLDDVVLE